MSDTAAGAIRDALAAAGLLAGVRGKLPEQVTGIADDSRMVTPGSLFAAVRGTERDGHEFLPAAESKGAAMAVVDDEKRTSLPVLIVNDTRRAAAVAASVVYGYPARELTLAGVTGTNGKTTTVGILRHLLDGEGHAASIGTLGVLVGSEGVPFEGGGGLTTPGPVELQRVLRGLIDKGVTHVAMEVSSHALEQRRTETLTFATAVFTNLTRDHLDYHGTMDAYLDAKLRLADQVHEDGTLVINLDDQSWKPLGEAKKRVTFSVLGGNADVRSTDIRFGARGSEWKLHTGEKQHKIRLPLIGDFNVANALGASAAAISLGMTAKVIAKRLATLPQIPGRLEIIAEEPAVLRDYAHTPDALARALDAVRPFAKGRLIVVFGCGGDRDRGKRPEMGRIAEMKADLAIVTSDNPRTEDPDAIIDEIEKGMSHEHERITERREAIARAIDIAKPGDIVVLAGKGHETYQVLGTTKVPFDEREIVHEILASRPKKRK
jgi:UDP-N-acetylmuramoyl-L-alanyl-D-glutamate--2,6-diaminopimelate ligase